jgi:predicted nucleotidyltransferase
MSDIFQIRQQLDRFTAAHPEIACAYLFGSAAGGRFTKTSDIDLGLAASHPLSADAKAHLRAELEDTIHRDIDLVDLQQATGSILRQALHGICILCRNTTVRYQVMRRLIYDQEDMQPLRNQIMQQRRLRFAYGH